jgi:hypothetical protein
MGAMVATVLVLMLMHAMDVTVRWSAKRGATFCTSPS